MTKQELELTEKLYNLTHLVKLNTCSADNKINNAGTGIGPLVDNLEYLINTRLDDLSPLYVSDATSAICEKINALQATLATLRDHVVDLDQTFKEWSRKAQKRNG